MFFIYDCLENLIQTMYLWRVHNFPHFAVARYSTICLLISKFSILLSKSHCICPTWHSIPIVTGVLAVAHPQTCEVFRGKVGVFTCVCVCSGCWGWEEEKKREQLLNGKSTSFLGKDQNSAT